MSKRNLIATLALTLFVLGIAQAQALMPPHVNSAEPANDGILYGDTLVLNGHTLEYAQNTKLKLTHLESGKAVSVTSKTSCKQVGECGKNYKPGSCQSSCALHVTLKEVVAGARYEVKFLDWTSQFKAATKEEQKAHDEKAKAPEKEKK
jgi:hypothetical protein